MARTWISTVVYESEGSLNLKMFSDSYELLVECCETVAGSRFTVAYHFENAVRSAGERCHPNRMKRLAQEAATLTTSLPLSNSSSVFVRCDTDRLDIMKASAPSDSILISARINEQLNYLDR